MLEGIQILIDRMEMFPDDFREGGNLHDFLHILDETNYYEKILTKEEIAAYKEATLKFHRENFNRRVIETVMERRDHTQAQHKFAEMLSRSMKNTAQTMHHSILNNAFTNSGLGGGGTGTYTTSTTKAPEILTGASYDSAIGGGAFVTKTGALFTPANIPKKSKK